MGEHVKALSRKWWTTALVAGALVLAVTVAGCSGSPAAESGAPAADAVPLPPSAAATETPAAAPDAAAAAQLMAIAVTPAGDGDADVVLRVDGPLSWTSFEGEPGVVVELRGVVPRGDVTVAETATGPVRSVAVDVERGNGPPVSRVTIATRGEVESTLDDSGGALTVRLRGIESSTASDSAAESALPVPAPRILGTPEEPVRGPEPRGLLGTWLRSVAVDAGETGTDVTLHGDGQFRHSSFGLQDPSRLVVDLEGVAAAKPWSSFPVGDGPVERVRAAQYRVDPEPVTRVVVDLGASAAPAPVIEPLATGLRLSFPREMTTEEAVAEVEAEAVGMDLGAAPEPVPEPIRDPVPERTPEATPEPSPQPASEPDLDPLEQQEPEPVVEPAPVPEPEPERQTAPEPTPPPQEPLVVEAPGEEEILLGNGEPAASQEQASAGIASQPIAEGEREYHGEPIDVTITDADLKATLRDFAQLSGLNIVVHPDVSGSVTVNLKGVPWDQALEQILKMNDLAYEVEGNIMRVAPRAQFHEEAQAEQEMRQIEALSVPLQTVIKRISYGTASEVAAVLRGETGGSVLSERGSVVVDDRTNTLIIRELPRYMNTVLSIIEHLDAPEPQVHIEARIVETNKDFSRTLGIRWGFAGVADAAHGNTTGLEFPNNISGEGGVNLIRGGENGILSLAMGNVLNTFTLDATLQAAENEGLANILSTPSVTVLNNEPAEIQSGVSLPIQTVANNTVSVQFVNATLRLQVTPHVTADGTVLLDITIQKRQPRPDLLVPEATNLPIATREASTRVIVADGGTTVIGGIYEVETSEAEDRVPGLANIPLLGHLFRNKDRQERNEELLIFITPRVLKL